MTEGPHNPGQELDLAWLEEARINLPAVLRRAATYGTRRTVKQQWQAAWLLRAVTCIDLTTLAGDDTETNVARLCLKAARPVRKDLLQVRSCYQGYFISDFFMDFRLTKRFWGNFLEGFEVGGIFFFSISHPIVMGKDFWLL